MTEAREGPVRGDHLKVTMPMGEAITLDGPDGLVGRGDEPAPVLLAHELMSSLHLYAVVHSERHTDACSVVGGRQAKSVGVHPGAGSA